MRYAPNGRQLSPAKSAGRKQRAAALICCKLLKTKSILAMLSEPTLIPSA